jgi:hypothetical protein
MNSISCKTIALLALVIVTPVLSKRPHREKPPRPPKQPLTQEQKQVIASNIAQVMGGICTIVQDPHNPNTIGNSVANMIHGLINIAVAKIARKKISRHTCDALDEYLDELCKDISTDITEIIIENNLQLPQKLSP